LGSPEDQQQYRTLKNSQAGIKSDITVILNNNHKNPNIQFRFKDAFPISISSISMDVTATDVSPIEATASFRYNKFSVDRHS
jgi:hypothetical protein